MLNLIENEPINVNFTLLNKLIPLKFNFESTEDF